MFTFINALATHSTSSIFGRRASVRTPAATYRLMTAQDRALALIDAGWVV